MDMESLSKYLLHTYGFNVISIESIVSMNELYTLVASNHKTRYILKLYKQSDMPLSRINTITQLLTYLQSNGVKVSYPIKGLGGDYVHELAGKYAVLYSYANGQHYSKLSHHQSFLFGCENAQIHLNATHFDTKDLPIKKTKELLVNPLATLSIGHSERHHELRYIRGLANVVADKLSHLSPYQSVCHGDYHWGNVFFDDERITVFDFDFCCKSWRIYDAVVFLWNLLFSQSNDVAGIWSEFLSGYQSVVPLTETEIEAIPWLLIAHNIWHMGYIADVPIEDWEFDDYWFDKKFSLFEDIQNMFPSKNIYNKQFKQTVNAWHF